MAPTGTRPTTLDRAGPTVPDVSFMAAALSGVLKTYGRHRLELEFRLGQRICGKFVPGVSEEGWHRLKTKLDESPDLTASHTNVRELIPGDNANPGAKYVVDILNPTAPAYWMHKKRLRDFDMDPDRHGPWGCRASLSLEVVDPPEAQKPPPVGCKFERHKQRWSYAYRCWSFDLTKVASNLPHQQDNDTVSYEVEIELVHTAEFFTRPVPEVLEWGLRLVDDCCGMLRPAVPAVPGAK